MIRSTIPIGYLARLVAFGWENVVYFARRAVGMCILIAQCVAQVVMLASAPETDHSTYAQARLRREIFTGVDKDETTMATAEHNFFTVVDGDNFAIRQFGMMIKLRRRIVCSGFSQWSTASTKA